MPTYLERTLGTPPLIAGLALAVLTLGWPISASLSGRLYLRIGFRSTVLIGLAFAVVGAVALAVTASTPALWFVALCCFVIGLGMGLIAVPSLIAAQSSVAWNERGVVTGTNLFARSIGSAVGVAIFGGLANAILLAAGTNPVVVVVEQASGTVSIGVAVAAVVTVVAAVAMPRQSRVETAGGEAAAAAA